MILFLHTIITNITYFLGNFGNSLLSIPKIILQSKPIAAYPKTVQNRASILANGPSLRNSLADNLAFIKETEVYCVNNFASSSAFQEIKPQNYVLLDPAFFSFDPKNSTREDIRKTLFALIETVTWDMNLFAPTHARKSNLVREITQKNKNIKISFFNYTIVKGFTWFRNWIYNTKLGMPQCQNILGASLYVTIVRKHSFVYLFGADHSWHEELQLDENNELIGRQMHFYDKPESIAFVKADEDKLSKIYLRFQSLAKAFYSYEVLRQFADYQGVKVFNASYRSYVDAFPKVKV